MTQEIATPITSLDIRQIMGFLPHRYPFLMIDRVVDIRGDAFGIGIKAVTVNEPQFTGHFPGQPIFPGVLLVEGMAQTGGVLCIAQRGSGPAPLVYFMSIDKAKFRKPVVPGDVVEHRMTKIQHRGNIWRYKGESFVGSVKVAEAEVTAMLAESSVK